jgi:hypothetical protein
MAILRVPASLQVALFVDGANFHFAARALDVEYKRPRHALRAGAACRGCRRLIALWWLLASGFHIAGHHHSGMRYPRQGGAPSAPRCRDTKIMRLVIALRKSDKDDIAEEEAVLEMYKECLWCV